MANLKIEALILEPDLELRKDLSQLFPMNKFNLKFMNSYAELAENIQVKIPHIVAINFDFKPDKLSVNFPKIGSMLPIETIIIGLSEKADSPAYRELAKYGLNETWKRPLVGLKVKPRLNSYADNLKPLKLHLNVPQKVKASVKGELKAVGETDYIIETPIHPDLGTKLDVHSPLLEKTLGERKISVVSENRHAFANDSYKYKTLTMLGLKNEDLQKIRARVLQWEKL